MKFITIFAAAFIVASVSAKSSIKICDGYDQKLDRLNSCEIGGSLKPGGNITFTCDDTYLITADLYYAQCVFSYDGIRFYNGEVPIPGGPIHVDKGRK